MRRKMVTYWVCTSAIHDPKSCTDSTAVAAWLYIALIPICWHSLCSRVMRRQPPAALLSWMMLHRPLWLVKHTIPDTITINIRSPAQGNSKPPLHQGLVHALVLTSMPLQGPALASLSQQHLAPDSQQQLAIARLSGAHLCLRQCNPRALHTHSDKGFCPAQKAQMENLET